MEAVILFVLILFALALFAGLMMVIFIVVENHYDYKEQERIHQQRVDRLINSLGKW